MSDHRESYTAKEVYDIAYKEGLARAAQVCDEQCERLRDISNDEYRWGNMDKAAKWSHKCETARSCADLIRGLMGEAS